MLNCQGVIILITSVPTELKSAMRLSKVGFDSLVEQLTHHQCMTLYLLLQFQSVLSVLRENNSLSPGIEAAFEFECILRLHHTSIIKNYNQNVF